MERKIIKDSPLPLYYQLKQIIIEKIENRLLEENDKLPTEKELCDQYNISRATVRQALTELEIEEYIYKIQGKGSFVSPKKLSQNLLSFYSFTDEMKKLGKVPSSKVMNFKVLDLTENIAKKLRLDNQDKVYEFTRLRLADNEPMILETTYIPYNLFPGIFKEDLEKIPLYDILKNQYNIVFSKAEEIFSPTLLSSEEAKLLKSIEGGPVLLIERITYDNMERVIEYTKSVARGDKFKYRVVLEK
ncbi:MAG: GntR family transcriptional regulator [Desulfobacterales bacterium]|nr:GntR family transcriptional regulator [Desulfobacterales bacterium]